jgi:Caspase domain
VTLLPLAQPPAETPQLHALLVGVGEYPHLVGGALYETQRAPKTFTLPQLSSPPISAAAVADWLLSQHDNPSTPLGSIELLLSPASYAPEPNAAARIGLAAGATVSVPWASFDQIAQAAQRWYDRLDSNPLNIGVFYFCGHGLEASDRYLLAADFGSNPADWTHGIINFDQTHLNMETCTAETQCYLLDACRDKPAELQERAVRVTVGKPLIGLSAGASHLRNAPLLHAAAPGDSAAGPPNGKSYLSEALIDCLNGMGARAPVGAFAPVDLVSLGQALLERVDRLAREASLPLRCTMDSHFQVPTGMQLPLHQAKVPVRVMTTVTCRPTAAAAAATITVNDGSGRPQVRPANSGNPWRLTVQSGQCNVAATFDPTIPFSDLSIDFIATPPVFPIPLDVLARQAPVAGGPNS